MDSDLRPPRVFNTVTSSAVTYNMDTVEYLIQQELVRRKAAGAPAMSSWELAEFKRKLIGKLIIQGDALGAINLRPQETRKILLEQ